MVNTHKPIVDIQKIKKFKHTTIDNQVTKRAREEQRNYKTARKQLTKWQYLHTYHNYFKGKCTKLPNQ